MDDGSVSNIRVFIDFGSTFTKMVAFDVQREELAARVQVPSTVDSDITLGLEEAFERIAGEVKIGDAEKRRALACSSAAGGLRMVCVGLVADYTTLAGRMAALGAGAKIVGEYSYALSAAEVAEIEEMAPDIVLLTGGTDGGNTKVITHNAALLAGAGRGVRRIIVAGNKSAYDQISAIFAGSDKHVEYAKNVMPEIGVLDVEPCNRKIREVFLHHITAAKGIARAKTVINDVILPTPSAVMAAAGLLAGGLPGCPGLGELVLVDVGGATTDVYSVAAGTPAGNVARLVGLPEPYVKRTVEGDLGLVHNVDILQGMAKSGEVPEHFDETVKAFYRAGKVPQGKAEAEAHLLLSRLAVQAAVERHAGKIEKIVTPGGDMLVQKGKDLTGVRTVIGSGGAVSFSADPRRVLQEALFQETAPALLKPKSPRLMLDRYNLLFAVGLLAQSEPSGALRIGMKYLQPL